MSRIENCPTRFRYRCSQEWAGLLRTQDDDIRHCLTCDEDVYHCETVAEFLSHAEKGHCVAVASLSELPPARPSLGRPEVPSAETLWALTEALRKQALEDEGKPEV